MMGKVAILKLEGDLKQKGFNVTVTIAPEGNPTSLEISGFLPPNPQLAAQIEHH